MEKIEAQLKRLNPELSMHESQVLWSRVEQGLTPRGARSPKRKSSRSIFRAVVAGLVTLGLLGGSVVTAYASEALPGDTLYSAKLTLEQVQLALATSPKKKELQLAFADRRVKEVSAVLADIEEEEGDAAPVAAMFAEVAPASTEVSGAALAADTPAEGAVPQAAENAFAMNTMVLPEDTESSHGGRQKKNEDPLMPETVAPMMAMRSKKEVRQEDAPSIATETSSTYTFQQGNMFPGQQKGKRWKNLDKKKNALNIAIRELERSREALKEGGATSTSERVDEVIVNLTQLNTTGTTDDHEFVERIKQRKVRVLEDHKGKNEDSEQVDRTESSQEGESGRRGEDRPQGMNTPPTLTQEQGAVALAGDSDVSLQDTQKELEEVKMRNADRKKRFQAQVINTQGHRRSGLWKEGTTEKRVPVCFESGEDFRELLVPEKDVPKYLGHGFTSGTCPLPAPSTLPVE